VIHNSAIVDVVDYDTYEQLLSPLTGRARAAFGCVCAERVFAIYESAFDVPGVDPPTMRKGLEMAWRYAEGHVFAPGELEEIGAVTNAAVPDSEDCQDSFAAHYAGCAIGNAIIAPRVKVGASAAGVNALDAVRDYEEHSARSSDRSSADVARVVQEEHLVHRRLAAGLASMNDSQISRDCLAQFLR
jgi:hypothetical protein